MGDINTSATGPIPNDGKPEGKPFRTPSKNKSDPAPHIATDGHVEASADRKDPNDDYKIDEDTPEDNGGDDDTRAAANQPRVPPVDGPISPAPGAGKGYVR